MRDGILILVVIICIVLLGVIVSNSVKQEQIIPIPKHETAPVMLTHNDGTSFHGILYIREVDVRYLLSEGTWRISADPDWKIDREVR